MKKKWLKKLLAGMLVASMCVTQVPYGVMNGANVAYAQENNLLTDGDFESQVNWWEQGCVWNVEHTGEGKVDAKKTRTVMRGHRELLIYLLILFKTLH